MSDEAGKLDGGLSAPAKRGPGRPRKPESAAGADSGITLGDKEQPGGIEELAGAGGGVDGATPSSGPERIAGFPAVDPFRASDHGPRKRRGRPPGRRATQEKIQNDIAVALNIEKALIAGCFFLGNIASAPELQVDETEAKEVADALRDLSKYYPLVTMTGKALAWVNVTLAVGGVFGPKVAAIWRRPKTKLLLVPPTTSGPVDPKTNGGISEFPILPTETSDYE